MKFSENLQKLRKEKGLSQEALAEQLDVTRQSVSKWESGASYPEMDKLLALGKIFDVELEVLLNKDISELKSSDRELSSSKDLLSKADEAMKKLIYFFDHMSAKELVKFIVTICIIFVILMFIKIPFNFFTDMINQEIFYAMGSIGITLSKVFSVLMNTIYIFFVIAAFLYAIKIKYIDRITIKRINETSEQIIIKDENIKLDYTEKGSVSSFLSQIIVYFLKFIAIIIDFFFGISILCLIAFIGITISLLINGFPLIGIIFCLFGALLLAILLFLIPFNFIMNHKCSYKKMLITAGVSIFVLIIGSATFAVECFKMSFVNDVPHSANKKEEVFMLPMSNNLNSEGLHNYYNDNDIEYVIDNTLTDKVKVVVSYYEYLGFKNKIKIEVVDDIIHSSEEFNQEVVNINEIIKEIGRDLKNKKIYNYEKIYDTTTTIYTSEENIIKIKENNKRYIEDINRRSDEEYGF